MTIRPGKLSTGDVKITRVLDDTTLLTARVNDLTRTVDQLKQQVEALSAARRDDQAALAALQARYSQHVHRVRGMVGTGFMTGRIDGQLRKYIFPAETDEARRMQASTFPPEG
ncbi:hypothetical protein [Glacieibacterium frigidum]|uniref:Uncharacterized protein n=1 Tax=Glacieibacterium frigidum TaxID=2593303 RepID=A0A552UI99_9SPHN|nr:hypothetical protein [Glacieibacterium frigidum]TRW17949.1 hypothetical protein FMM06_07455 [Glacieibacterium frigidum]